MPLSDSLKPDSLPPQSYEPAEAAYAPPVDRRFWPLLVQLRKQSISRGLWEVDSWSLRGCDSDRGGQQRQALNWVEQRLAADAIDYRWSGLSLELFRDERAAYRFNLSASDPRLFVICYEEEGLMQPFLVTASQDVAASYMDGGEEDVYSTPMPAAIQCWIEGFIARHGEPEMEVGKSKRRHHGRRDSGRKSRPSAPASQTAASQAVSHSDTDPQGAKHV